MSTTQDTQHTICITVCLTPDQHQRLLAIDGEWKGSEHYMGLAYFWNYEYRFELRDATANQRVRVHRGFLEAGLPLDGTSLHHVEIIEKVLGRRCIQLRARQASDAEPWFDGRDTTNPFDPES